MPFIACLLIAVCCARLVAGENATAEAKLTAEFVTAITVTSGGSGYTAEPAVALSGGGGSGASAKAILAEDKVLAIVVLNAGSGYSTVPVVVIEAPQKVPRVRLRLVPELTVEGPAGSLARVEAAWAFTGPWTTWTNVTLGSDGTLLVDFSLGSATRFYRSVIVGTVGFVWIPPGNFVMGSPLSEADRNIDEVQHTVTLTQGFWMGDHEVTQQDYQELIGSNPSSFKGSNLPVESVSWNDAVEYCKKLTERERSAGRITAQQAYRLPTEAEWEYAARAESVETRPGELGPIAWWFGNSDSQTHVVKQKVANAWGLHDMLGNVWEWCSDVYWAYPTVSVIDPTGPSSGPLRVSRGGSWNENTKNVRSAGRLRDIPTSRGSDLGFRCVLSESR